MRKMYKKPVNKGIIKGGSPLLSDDDIKKDINAAYKCTDVERIWSKDGKRFWAVEVECKTLEKVLSEGILLRSMAEVILQVESSTQTILRFIKLLTNMVVQKPNLQHTQWADSNFMLLNPEKTVIINFLINYNHVYDQVFDLDNVSIFPSKEVMFLGVTLDDHLTFSSHMDNIVSSCSSKLSLLRQLKKKGMNSNGLKRFITANIRSIISYATMRKSYK